MRLARLLCRLGKHRWAVETWIPVDNGGARAVVRYSCRRCGASRNVWQAWPTTRKQAR